MNALDSLEAESIYILREAFALKLKMAMLWSFGKDSNVCIHLARKAFFGRVPFPLIHCDTGLEFPEVYAFRKRYAREWEVELLALMCPPLEETDARLPPAARVASRKTLGLKAVQQEHGFRAIITGIRRDEEPTRAKERVFSPRDEGGQWQVRTQPLELWGYANTHFDSGTSVRIHPLLGWTEIDIWRYTQREHIPTVPLYFAKEYDGVMKRFRSLGEQGITAPVPSNATTLAAIIQELETTRTAERSGRPMGADEDESSFERLRHDGYM